MSDTKRIAWTVIAQALHTLSLWCISKAVEIERARVRAREMATGTVVERMRWEEAN